MRREGGDGVGTEDVESCSSDEVFERVERNSGGSFTDVAEGGFGWVGAA